MPKRNSEEFKQLQERLKTARPAEEPAPSEHINSAPPPKGLKRVFLLALLPGAAGLAGLAQADYYTEAYPFYLRWTGGWVVFGSAVTSAAYAGAEAIGFNPPAYRLPQGLFAGWPRLWLSFMNVPAGVLAMWACRSGSWKSWFVYLLFQAGFTVYALGVGSRSLAPPWLVGMQFIWAVSCQVVALSVMYSLFSKEMHMLRMQQMHHQIQEGTYSPE